MVQEQEVIELSLQKVIETKLVQNNVTDQVIAALKNKYSNLKLAALDDKESYLEIKSAAKECGKVRNLAVKICKEGREDAVKTQKLWVAKEKEVVSSVLEVEAPLDAEIELYDNEVKRKQEEEMKRQESAYINRQATLTKLGARYEDGSFVLGETAIEGNLVKSASDEIWNETIVPTFEQEFSKIEAVRIAIEKEKSEKERMLREEQEKLQKEQEAFRLQQEEFARQQAEATRIEREKLEAEQREKQRIEREAEYERMKEQAKSDAEAKRVADIKDAIKKEQERQVEEAKKAELMKKQAEERRIAELESAGDRVKWEEFITSVTAITTFEMRSGQYRKKMQIAKEKIEEILSL